MIELFCIVSNTHTFITTHPAHGNHVWHSSTDWKQRQNKGSYVFDKMRWQYSKLPTVQEPDKSNCSPNKLITGVCVSKIPAQDKKSCPMSKNERPITAPTAQTRCTCQALHQ